MKDIRGFLKQAEQYTPSCRRLISKEEVAEVERAHAQFHQCAPENFHTTLQFTGGELLSVVFNYSEFLTGLFIYGKVKRRYGICRIRHDRTLYVCYVWCNPLLSCMLTRRILATKVRPPLLAHKTRDHSSAVDNVGLIATFAAAVQIG